MAEDVAGFLETVTLKERMTVTVRVYDGDGYAPLGVDTRWLRNILFCGGVAEVSTAYLSHALGLPVPRAYRPEMLRDAAGTLSARLGDGRQSWIDVYETEQEFFARMFQLQLQQRAGGLWSVGDGEILRLELVAISKENPTVLKILVSGAMAAMLALGGCFVGVHLMRENGAAACRQQYLDYDQKQTERLLKTAKFEGKFTAEQRAALESVNSLTKAGIAACGSSLDDAGMTFKPGEEPEVTFHVSPKK
jgi:hypothetical protein